MASQSTIKVYFGDNIKLLRKIASNSIDMIYIDPPFNTGVKQIRNRFRTENGVRISENTYGYQDSFDNFIGFLEPRMKEAYRILKDNGSFFFHLDYREIHYCKVMLDQIFGRASFINEIIWAYDYGARSKNKWSAKHDNILWYAKNPKSYIFNYAEMDRIPYMAPGLVGPEKAALGKTPTDVWWHTIVSPNSKEKTGYATQKPLGIINRILKIHSCPGDTVMDFFFFFGTLGEAAAILGRNCILIDQNPEAIAVMKKRFLNYTVEWINCDDIKMSEEVIASDKHERHLDEPEGFTQPLAISVSTLKTENITEILHQKKRRGRPPKKKIIQEQIGELTSTNCLQNLNESLAGKVKKIIPEKHAEYKTFNIEQGSLI